MSADNYSPNLYIFPLSTLKTSFLHLPSNHLFTDQWRPTFSSCFSVAVRSFFDSLCTFISKIFNKPLKLFYQQLFNLDSLQLTCLSPQKTYVSDFSAQLHTSYSYWFVGLSYYPLLAHRRPFCTSYFNL